MGQVIHLHRERSIAGAVHESRFGASHDFSRDEAGRVFSGCLEMRRQIGLLLELAIQADRIIDGVADDAVRAQLREKSIRSHVELIGALAQISSTITTLDFARAESGRDER